MTVMLAPTDFAGMRLPAMSIQDQAALELARRKFAQRARILHRIKRPDEQIVAGDANRMLRFRNAPIAVTSAARGRRREILAKAVEVELRTIQRAKAALQLKLRIAYGIPVHEWADAQRRVNGVAALLQVYAPDAAETLPPYITPRCPPWASRRYRRGF